MTISVDYKVLWLFSVNVVKFTRHQSNLRYVSELRKDLVLFEIIAQKTLVEYPKYCTCSGLGSSTCVVCIQKCEVICGLNESDHY